MYRLGFLIRNLAIVNLLYIGGVAAYDTLPKTPPTPPDNPVTEAKIELGKMLFFDPRLSADGTVSCNSCHNVMSNGSDNRPVSVGVSGQKGGRSAPTVFNAAYMSVQFWDGRAATLEEQAKGPILNPVEMGMPNPEAVVERISAIAGYRERFSKVFGGQDAVSYDNIAKAIATYERTLITTNSKFDKFARGDKTALSSQAKQGLTLVEKIGCTGCHNGLNFAGPADLAPGQGFYQKFPTYTDNEYVKKYGFLDDPGRYNVTKKSEDKNIWRVPTWRNVALTAPYFHNGAVATLDEAVRVMAKTQLNITLDDQEVALIVAFLNSLSGEIPAQTLPRLPNTVNVSSLSE